MGQLVLRSVGGVAEPALYTVDLLNGDYANVVRGAGVWSLIIHPQNLTPRDRGLFSTPSDALAVLEAEVSARAWSNEVANDRKAIIARAPLDRRQQAGIRHLGSPSSSEHDRRKAG
jgi:hypothetical protein